MPPQNFPGTGELTPEYLRETALLFQKSRIFLTAYELGIFTALGDTQRTASEVAAITGCNERAVERLMNALCAVGLLHKLKVYFSNSALSARYLVKGKPDYLAGLMHSVNMWDTWNTLTDAVRKGKSVFSRKRRKDSHISFIAAMHERARKQSGVIAALIDFTGVQSFFDLGGGSGAYAMAFARTHPDMTAVVFDLPDIIPLTQEYIKQENLSNHVRTIAGDYTQNDIGSGYDMIFMSAIIHSNSFETNKRLIDKCVKALNDNGQVIVLDFIMSEDRISPQNGAFFALNMLVATESGDTYTESEVRSWMTDAGLSEIHRKDTGFGSALIIGRKKV